jgi:signal peptidase I
VLELLKNGRRFDCRLDLSNGGVSLAIPGRGEADQPKAAAGGISRAGSHRLLFANVDHQLTVLVNNKAVQFDKPVQWDDFDGASSAFPPGQPADDVSPVGIGSSGAAVTVSHLRVLRDIYYTSQDTSRPAHPNYAVLPRSADRWPSANQWLCYPRSAIVKLQEAGADVRADDQFFFVGADQFFPMGDNSPSSQDGRFWLSQYHFDGQGKFRLTTRNEDDYNFVDRRLLVGKALYIYWPHSFFFPIPNFPRMGFVR